MFVGLGVLEGQPRRWMVSN